MSRSGAPALRWCATVAPPAPPPTITTFGSVCAMAHGAYKGAAATPAPAAPARRTKSRRDGRFMPPVMPLSSVARTKYAERPDALRRLVAPSPRPACPLCNYTLANTVLKRGRGICAHQGGTRAVTLLPGRSGSMPEWPGRSPSLLIYAHVRLRARLAMCYGAIYSNAAAHGKLGIGSARIPPRRERGRDPGALPFRSGVGARSPELGG